MYYLYARVSTAEQVSIPEQLRQCHAIATLKGCSSMDRIEYSDHGVSGSIPLDARPQGRIMFEACRPGDTIVCCKLDRLFRSARDALVTADYLDKKQINLIIIDLGVEPVASAGTAKLFFGLLSVLAEFERDRIRERTEDGRRVKRERGGYMGGHAPYGFQVVGTGRAATLVENPATEEIEQVVRTMIKDGHKSGRVARYLSQYYPMASGKAWQQVQVDRIVSRLNG